MRRLKIFIFFVICFLSIICFGRVDVNAKTLNEIRSSDYFEAVRESVADFQIIYQMIKTDIVTNNDRIYTVYIDEFSGAYLDNEGLLNILLSNKYDGEEISMLINAIYNATGNDKIIYNYVDFSYNYLQQILLNLEEIMIQYGILSVGIDEKINKVFIESAINNEQQIIDYLRGKNNYDSNSLVYYYSENLNSYSDFSIAYGGESIYYYIDDDYISRGTIGVNAVRNDNGQMGILTNEHVAPLNTTMYYGGYWNGTYHSTSALIGNCSIAQNGGTIDAAFVSFQYPIDWEVLPYSQYNSTIFENIKLGTESLIISGQPILRIGQTTGVTTGEIRSTNVSYTTNDILKTNLFRYTNDGQGGDSGGPVYYNNGIDLYLLGLHFCSSDVFLGGRQGFACRISNIMSQLNVTPITNDCFLQLICQMELFNWMVLVLMYQASLIFRLL